MFKFATKDLEPYKGSDPRWGQVGIMTYKRTYSRPIYNEATGKIAKRENWLDTCVRVIEGNMNLVPGDPTATRDWALDALQLMHNMAWLPPGRGLWMMGTDYAARRGGDALNNCWYISVKPQSYEDMDMFKGTWNLSHPLSPMPSFPFVFMFDRAMLGGGVGFGISKKNLNQYQKLSTRCDLRIVLDSNHPDWERIKSSEEYTRFGLDKVLTDRRPDIAHTYHRITDDREGWAVSVRETIDAHWQWSIMSNKQVNTVDLVIDLSDIREYGAGIKGFGGTASGPTPLIAALVTINNILNSRAGKKLRSVDALDMMNILGRCVVAGNVRRTALIGIGDADDKDYVDAKNYMIVAPIIDTSYGDWGWYTNEWGRKTQKLKDRDVVVGEIYEELKKAYGDVRFPQENIALQEEAEEKADYLFDMFWKQDNHRWASNNSVYTNEVFKDHHFIAAGIIANGEPGIGNTWLMKNFGRIKDGFQEAIDADAEGLNPCAEITLWNGEPCNIAEVIPYRARMFGYDVKRCLEIATQYCYRITFAKYSWAITERIIKQNRRIGVSLTGMQDYYLAEYGHYALVGFEDVDITKPIFDTRISDELDQWYEHVQEVNENHAVLLKSTPSIKLTTNKPSGTVAKLPGVSSGIHWHYSAYMIQRIRFNETDPNLTVVKACGLPIEKAIKEPNTVIVEFPVKNPNADHPGFRSSGDVSLEEQFANQFLFANYWADNAVSATLTFQQSETHKIEPLLQAYNNKIKSTSLLPYTGHGYVQAPWEPITKEEYERRVAAMTATPEEMYPYFDIMESGDILDDDCQSGACPTR